MAEDVGRCAHLGGAGEESVDLLPPRRERHRPVQRGDAAGVQLVQLAGDADDCAAAERDDDRPRPQARDRLPPDPVERRLALEEADVRVRERMPDERQRLHRAEQQDVPVFPAEHQSRPCGAAFLVLGPLHLVQHERLAVHRRHLRRAADDRRVRVDALLAGDEADALLPQLLGEHAQRRGVDAAAVRDEEAERVVRLPRVRRPEMRDDGLRLGRPLRQADGQLGDRLAPGLPALVALAPGGTLLAPGGHGATVA